MTAKVVRLRTEEERRQHRRAKLREYEAHRDYKREYRLAKKRWAWQQVRLDPDDHRMLRVVAQRERTAVAELIRRFIVWGLEQYEGEIDYDADCDR